MSDSTAYDASDDQAAAAAPEGERVSLGRAAYDAYGNARQWTTLEGAAMAVWDDADPDVQAAWEQAGSAAAAAASSAGDPGAGDGDG